ncbi:MAG: hypothetical protein M3264_14255 [Thermoproteota archaeon]|nr:hypothetical protein [Thermoproteota archaeon]
MSLGHPCGRNLYIEEATAGTSPEAHRAALQSLEYLQHGAIVHLGEVVEAMKSFVFPQS